MTIPLTASPQQLWEALLPGVPWVVGLCAFYLAANDVLDFLLLVRGRMISDKIGFWRAVKRTGWAGFMSAVRNDFASVQVVVAAALAVGAAIEAGGNTKAQIIAALVGVAAANVGNFERSTIGKLKELFSPFPQPAPLPPPDPAVAVTKPVMPVGPPPTTS